MSDWKLEFQKNNTGKTRLRQANSTLLWLATIPNLPIKEITSY